MIDRDGAVAICENHFPHGLDRLMEMLSVRVDRSNIGDVDGWCYYLPDGSRVARLCSAKTKERQRFTLAHELAHFVLDGQRRQMAIIRDVYDPKGPEEREADALASRLLLPTEKIKGLIGPHVVDYSTINQLKKKAKVSDIVVALRLARAAEDFTLDRPAVVWFRNGQIEKSFPYHLSVGPSMVAALFEEAMESPAHMTSKASADGTTVFASLLPNANYPTLFYYHASPCAIQRSPKAEMLKELEKRLFCGDNSFRNSLNGCIRGHKRLLINMEIVDRVVLVIERFTRSRPQRPPEHIKKARSQDCVDYLIIRLHDFDVRQTN